MFAVAIKTLPDYACFGNRTVYQKKSNQQQWVDPHA